jgi:hypothetical protein
VTKPPPKAGQPWTRGDVQKLRDLAAGNTPTRVMGIKLGRSPSAISSKAHELGVSLKPTNQRPYSRRRR